MLLQGSTVLFQRNGLLCCVFFASLCTKAAQIFIAQARYNEGTHGLVICAGRITGKNAKSDHGHHTSR
jgi:hypothetical protein